MRKSSETTAQVPTEDTPVKISALIQSEEAPKYEEVD